MQVISLYLSPYLYTHLFHHNAKKHIIRPPKNNVIEVHVSITECFSHFLSVSIICANLTLAAP